MLQIKSIKKLPNRKLTKTQGIGLTSNLGKRIKKDWKDPDIHRIENQPIKISDTEYLKLTMKSNFIGNPEIPDSLKTRDQLDFEIETKKREKLENLESKRGFWETLVTVLNRIYQESPDRVEEILMEWATTGQSKFIEQKDLNKLDWVNNIAGTKNSGVKFLKAIYNKWLETIEECSNRQGRKMKLNPKDLKQFEKKPETTIKEIYEKLENNIKLNKKELETLRVYGTIERFVEYPEQGE